LAWHSFLCANNLCHAAATASAVERLDWERNDGPRNDSQFFRLVAFFLTQRDAFVLHSSSWLHIIIECDSLLFDNSVFFCPKDRNSGFLFLKNLHVKVWPYG
jgi:hypothetical protein